MYKSEQARQVIYHQDPTVNTDWLDAVTIDTDRMEITKADNEQLTKGFIRGLIAAKVIGIESLGDLGM
uniref:hypothetical protein n=1 Tax=Psychrobacter sp. TaxID=56811 RepID=UPI0015EEB59D|nr:hypothetical protein [Psychrobacter sp.]